MASRGWKGWDGEFAEMIGRFVSVIGLFLSLLDWVPGERLGW